MFQNFAEILGNLISQISWW